MSRPAKHWHDWPTNEKTPQRAKRGALANQRLGNPEEVRRWLGKAQKWLDQFGDGIPPHTEEELGLHLHNWLEAQILRREAEALISQH